MIVKHVRTRGASSRLCQNPIRERQPPLKSSFPRKRESRRGGVGKRRVGTPPGPLDSRFRGNDGGAVRAPVWVLTQPAGRQGIAQVLRSNARDPVTPSLLHQRNGLLGALRDAERATGCETTARALGSTGTAGSPSSGRSWTGLANSRAGVEKGLGVGVQGALHHGIR